MTGRCASTAILLAAALGACGAPAADARRVVDHGPAEELDAGGRAYRGLPTDGASPAQGAAAGGGAVERPAVEVPLALLDGRLVVPVETDDGRTLRFALSTGSDRTILSRSGEAEIGAASLSLGGLSLPTEPHATVPDVDLSVGDAVLDGQIGSNVLSEYDVLIDVPGGRLLLAPVGPRVAFEGADGTVAPDDVELSESVPLRIFHGVIISLDVTLDGTEYPASLELGARTLIANRGVQSDLSLEDRDTVTLGLGDATFAGTPVRVLDLDIFERWSPTGTGFVIVGASFLEECTISLSWIHREMRTCVR